MAGLYLLAIWLIEYDPEFQSAAATRLPVPVVVCHVLLAVGGLGVWLAYLVTDRDLFAWAALAVLSVVVSFGLAMALRWIGVYRGTSVSAATTAAAGRSRGERFQAQVAVPPERHFPVSVVVGHGFFAVITVILVLLTTLGLGGS
ncbi:MAG TPA: hypothetical protein VNF47_15080 [Streptosporangiaceae bacterium]|nr:hypothetical protein [Streptosporangiaceae bacterium]